MHVVGAVCQVGHMADLAGLPNSAITLPRHRA